MNNKIAAIVLAAGKGKRLNCTNVNKVMLNLNGKPMLSHSVELLKKINISPIILVIGHAKESITGYFKDQVLYAVQNKRLGTAHAASCGLKKVPPEAQNVLIINGDDSYLYSPDLLNKLINKHLSCEADITLLTVIKENPLGLGRIVRNEQEKIIGIIEEKDATEEIRKIKEINPQCWIFKVDFLKKFLPQIEKSIVTGEYYLTDLIQLAVKNGKKIEDIQAGSIAWRGVNTVHELDEAKNLFQKNFV